MTWKLTCGTTSMLVGSPAEYLEDQWRAVFFYGEGLLALCPIPKLEDHPLLVVCDWLFNIFATTLYICILSPLSTWRNAMPWWQRHTHKWSLSSIDFIYIQAAKKGTLQGLVVGRWVPSDQILLINLCSKTLHLRAIRLWNVEDK